MDLLIQSIPVFFAVLDPSMLQLIQGAACTTLGFKISLPITGQKKHVWLRDVEATRISRKSAREEGSQPYTRATFTPQVIILLLISVRG